MDPSSASTMDQKQTVKDAFNRAAETYAAHKASVDRISHEVMIRLSRVRAQHRVLDVGTGPGYIAMLFAAQAKSSVGVDLTKAFVDRATKTAAEREIANVTFQEGDAENLPFEKGSFDVVTTHKAFHHFPNPRRVLEEIHRVLVPGGRIVLGDTRSSDDPEKARRHNEWERMRDPSHVEMYSATQLRSMVEEAGFDVDGLEEWKDEMDVAWWQDVMASPEETYREIRQRLIDSESTDALDLAARVDGDRVWFRRRHVVIGAVRP